MRSPRAGLRYSRRPRPLFSTGGRVFTSGPSFGPRTARSSFATTSCMEPRAILSPYPGYINVFPRIAAWCAGRLPCIYAPRLYGLAALAALLFVVWRLASDRFPLRFRRAAALAPVLVAHGGEVFLNLTNVQWIFELLLIFLLIAKEPQTRRAVAADFATLLLAGLTGPFLILFAPLFAFRFSFYGRSRYNACIFAAALLLALAQGLTLYFSERCPTDCRGTSERPIRLAEDTFQAVFATGSGVQFFGDYVATGEPSREVVACVAIGAWLLILSQRGQRRRHLAALLLLAGVLVAASAVYQRGARRGALVPRPQSSRWRPLPLFAARDAALGPADGVGMRRLAAVCSRCALGNERVRLFALLPLRLRTGLPLAAIRRAHRSGRGGRCSGRAIVGFPSERYAPASKHNGTLRLVME